MTVADRHEPERIEIELTPHDAGPRRADVEVVEAAADGEVVVTTSPETDAGRDSPGRHLALLVSAVAVVALLAGVAVGRIGRGEPDEAGELDDGPPATSPTTPATADPADTLPAAEPLPPPTSTSRPTTTSVEDEPVVDRVVVDPAAPPLGVEVIGLSIRREVVRFDPTTGATVMVDAPAPSQFGPPRLHAGDGWVLLQSFDPGRESVVVHDDGSTTSIELGTSWPVLAGSSADRVWVAEEPSGGGPPERLVEVSIDGGAHGAELEVDGFFPRMADPLGGVVVDAPGGSYAVTTAGATRLTSGHALAVGSERMLAQECDEQFRCGYVVIERASGERRGVVLDPELGDVANLDTSSWWSFTEPWNPSQDALLVLVWSPTPTGGGTYGVLDLTDGSFIPIGRSTDVPAARWIDDQVLLWLDSGRLSWFDVTTGESGLVADDLVGFSTFTTRALRSG